MLTVEKLRKIVTEAYENDEWICVLTGDVFEIFKVNNQEEIEQIMDDVVDISDEEGAFVEVYDKVQDVWYTDADHAKDWNYFKNTMGI